MEEEEEGQDVLRQRRPGELAGEETARGGEELTAWRGDVLALAAGGEEDVWVRKRGRRRKQARSDVLYERPLVRRPLRDEGAQGRAEKMDGHFGMTVSASFLWYAIYVTGSSSTGLGRES